MKMLFFAIIVLMVAPASAYAPGCDRIDTFAAALGAELVPWVGYPKGWELPEDVQFVERTEFADGGGVWTMVAPSTKEKFVWYFVDFEPGPDGGAHNFCGPYRLTLEEEP